MYLGISYQKRIDMISAGELHPSNADLQFSFMLHEIGRGSTARDARILDRLVEIVEVSEEFFEDLAPAEYECDDWGGMGSRMHPITIEHQ